MHTRISRTCQDLVVSLEDMAPVHFHVGLVSPTQSVVQTDVGIELIPYHVVSNQASLPEFFLMDILDDFYFAPSGQSTSLDAVSHPSHQLVEATECRAAHLPVGFGV